MKNNKQKIIFVDIDWTILDHSHEQHVFDYESIEALKRAQKKGIKVFICTARPFHTVKLTGLLDLIEPDGLILSNGGLIVIDNKVIYEKRISNEIFEKICEVALKHDLTVEAMEPFKSFLIAPATIQVNNVFELYHDEIPPVEDYHNRNVISAILFATSGMDDGTFLFKSFENLGLE